MSAALLTLDKKDHLTRARAIVETLNIHGLFIKRGLSATGKVYLNIITGAMTQLAEGRVSYLNPRINDSILIFIPELEKLSSYCILGKPTRASDNPIHQELTRQLTPIKSELLDILQEIPLKFIGY